jgi:hypothetical protein
MKQNDISKYLLYVQYIMPYILIQVNEGIAKLVTLMVKGFEQSFKSLNVIPISNCDNSLTMKYNNIFEILDSLPIYHEIHVFKIICSPYNMV